MSDRGWNREAAERAERAARDAKRSAGWDKPSTCKRKRKNLIARMVGFLLGRKS